MKTKSVKPKAKSYNSKLKSGVKYRAYDFSLQIIKVINSFPNQRVFWLIGDQLLRSATSIGANIVEAQCASSRREFIKFYQIALKSANETKYWLCLLRDAKLLKETDNPEALLKEASEIARILASSLLTLKGKKKF